ncbi:FkbM family methyltransferase [Amylibacter sp. SFDW26]|uniref:FkbM family methyltransferase n=1 Tax=Amylibacter sp. SFDW26 TaxID=2652722 RepID=UPI001262514C|nr:FkbM family methyltransferase [Amylibacter sp. SFDW26]KAB7614515.1 FkbM family methyltransferase [Amylibacter sp. SFDW26]
MATSKKPSTTWATVTTLKETVNTTLNFVAHHLVMGADKIYLFFDDPNDAAIDIVSKNPKVHVVKCDEKYWASLEVPRPDAHQARQKANVRNCYGFAETDWLIHLDADEMVDADGVVVSKELSTVSDPVVRLQPYELMYQPGGRANNNFRYVFKGAIPQTRQGRRIAEKVYTPFHECLSLGFLSHVEGKFFVKTGVPDLIMSIHGPYMEGVRNRGETAVNMKLLHLHGGDFDEWMDHVKYRLEKGSYRPVNQKRIMRHQGIENTLGGVLQGLYDDRGDEGLKEFHQTVCTFGKSKRPLRRVGAIYKTNLWLDEKREDMFGKSSVLKNFGHDSETGAIEMDGAWGDVTMRLVPHDNYTERCIAIGAPAEAQEMQEMIKLASKKRVLFYDIGANAGVYSLQIAKAGKKTSRIISFEPNPVMIKRLKRNIDLNKFKNIKVVPKALGEEKGKVHLSLGKGGNLGQAAIDGDSQQGIEVTLSTLPSEMISPKGYDLSMLKIDVEGFEASVFKPMFENAKDVHWPDYIMMESAWNEDWDMDLVGELGKIGYTDHFVTKLNTIFKLEKN